MRRGILVYGLGLATGVAAMFAVRALDTPPNETTESAGRGDLADLQTQEDAVPSTFWEAEESPEAQAPVEEGLFGYAVQGFVLDPYDHAVAGAEVAVHNGALGDRWVVEADGGGHFEVAGLPLGVYTLEAGAAGFASHTRRDVMPGGGDMRVRLEPVADLVGRLVDEEGEGLARATVIVGGPGLHPAIATQTDEDGRFALSGIPRSGFVEVAACDTEAGTGFGSVVDLSQTTQVEIVAQTAPPMLLRLEDADGTPIPSGTVIVAGEPIHLVALSAPFEAGSVVLDCLPEGTYSMRVLAPGYLVWDGELAHAGQPQAITLERGATVRGEVHNPERQPLRDAQLSATIIDELGRAWRLEEHAEPRDVDRLIGFDGELFWPVMAGATTDAEGRFALSGVPAGRVVLRASAAGYVSRHSRTLESVGEGDLEEIVIRLRERTEAEATLTEHE